MLHTNIFTGSYHTYYTFDRIPTTLPIAADYVRCSGSENSLGECTYFSHSFSECSHDDDIGIICPPGNTLIFITEDYDNNNNNFLLIANCEDGDVRLRGTAGSEEEGLVLVCINKRWGLFCQNYNEENTKTLCRQLGYTYREGKKLFILVYIIWECNSQTQLSDIHSLLYCY